MIDRKTSSGDQQQEQQGRHWLRLQRLRSKAKRGTVDTRASKGRKTRFDIHAKLVSFAAPEERPGWWRDEARNELFSSLFGKCSAEAGTEEGNEEET